MLTRSGGGSILESNVVLSIDDSTTARKGSSLKILNGYPGRPIKTKTSINLFPATINRNYTELETFSNYPSGTLSPEENGFEVGPSVFCKIVGDHADDSKYNYVTYPFRFVSGRANPSTVVCDYMSIYAKSTEPMAIKVFFTDNVENTTSGFIFGPTTGKWKRFDVRIDKPIGWSDILKEIGFEIFGPVSQSLWMDDLILLDMRTSSEKSDWITLNMVDQTFAHTTNLVAANIAGNYGDVVFSTQANNRTGDIVIRTNAPDDDDDLAFLESIKNNAGRCFIRSLNEGWPICIQSMNVETNDSYLGSGRTIALSFVEEEASDD